MCGCHQAQRLATAHGRDGVRMPRDSLVVPGYGSRCRSHCCDLRTGVIVSGDVGCAATSAKRLTEGSALRMTAMIGRADRLGTRFSSVGSANRAKCAKSANCDPGWIGSCFFLLGLRSVRILRILRTVVCQVVGLIPQFAKFAGFAHFARIARQTVQAAVGAEFAGFTQFTVFAGIAGLADGAAFPVLLGWAGGTSE